MIERARRCTPHIITQAIRKVALGTFRLGVAWSSFLHLYISLQLVIPTKTVTHQNHEWKSLSRQVTLIGCPLAFLRRRIVKLVNLVGLVPH